MESDFLHPVELLEWYQTAGADESVAPEPLNRLSPLTEKSVPSENVQSPSLPLPPFPSDSPSSYERPSALPDAGTAEMAAKASTLDELKQIMQNFDGCPLKETATNMVFGIGKRDNPDVMLVGEAPGYEEDRQGVPFVGVSGQLLDKMLASIGLDREKVYISNILPWRPPGNRKPSESETALFTPFIRRHIALVRPKVLLMLGGSAVAALIGTTSGITKTRGKWMEYDNDGTPIPAFASFHPAFLLRTPAQKKLAWKDFQTVRQKLFRE